MALVIEDGSGVDMSNSYAAVSDFDQYCDLRGINLDKTEAEVEHLLIKAMDYLQSVRRLWQGYQAVNTQSLKWPRKGVYSEDGSELPSNFIPRELLYAQLALAVDAEDNDLQPSNTQPESGVITKEKLDGVGEVVYSNPDPRSYTPAFSKAEELLRQFYKQNGLTLVHSF